MKSIEAAETVVARDVLIRLGQNNLSLGPRKHLRISSFDYGLFQGPAGRSVSSEVDAAANKSSSWCETKRTLAGMAVLQGITY